MHKGSRKSTQLGTLPISKLLVQQAIPASIGILVMSLNMIVDTIFVGRWIGPLAISAISVVVPVTFFIGAIGLAFGIGGSSVLSRALGSGNYAKALQVFGNQTTLTILISAILAGIGLVFPTEFVRFFGADESFLSLALVYYRIVLYGIVMLAFCMMGNNVIRAEGKPKYAMYAMLLPAIGNIFMDYVLIKIFDMGMEGAAWATTGSYLLCFGFIFWFFLSKNSELKINKCHFGLNKPIVSEISSLGFVTLSRQAVVSITYLFMNNILFDLGGETSVTAYAIVGRMLMFALFPVYGITQGFLPIAGFNYGAKKYDRVKESIYTAIKRIGAFMANRHH